MRKQINTVFRSNTAPYKPLIDGEAIRIIKLNVRIGSIIIRDQFEWDINNPRNSPEVRIHAKLNSWIGFRRMPMCRSRSWHWVLAANSSLNKRADYWVLKDSASGQETPILLHKEQYVLGWIVLLKGHRKLSSCHDWSAILTRKHYDQINRGACLVKYWPWWFNLVKG